MDNQQDIMERVEVGGQVEPEIKAPKHDPFTSFVVKLGLSLDVIGRAAIFLIMVVVVINVVMRKLVPSGGIMGASEYVAFLSAIAISFTLGYCAINKGHIAVTMFVDKLQPKGRAFVDMLCNLVSLAFFGAGVWYLFLYGIDIMNSGEIAPTSRWPVFPFVFGVAFSFVALCLVLLVAVIRDVRRLAK